MLLLLEAGLALLEAGLKLLLAEEKREKLARPEMRILEEVKLVIQQR